jgi:hypothetical protein
MQNAECRMQKEEGWARTNLNWMAGRLAFAAMNSQERAFQEFAGFAAKLKGDEKSEAQTFLFHLLEAFGHDANTLSRELSAPQLPVRWKGT